MFRTLLQISFWGLTLVVVNVVANFLKSNGFL
jgi:hypothetical protein